MGHEEGVEGGFGVWAVRSSNKLNINCQHSIDILVKGEKWDKEVGGKGRTYNTGHTPEVDAVVEGVVEEDFGGTVVEWGVQGVERVVG